MIMKQVGNWLISVSMNFPGFFKKLNVQALFLTCHFALD